jgi:hypothetical protein
VEHIRNIHYLSFFLYVKDIQDIVYGTKSVNKFYEVLGIFRIVIILFKIQKIFDISNWKWSTILSNIFQITIGESQFINTNSNFLITSAHKF